MVEKGASIDASAPTGAPSTSDQTIPKLSCKGPTAPRAYHQAVPAPMALSPTGGVYSAFPASKSLPKAVQNSPFLAPKSSDAEGFYGSVGRYAASSKGSFSSTKSDQASKLPALGPGRGSCVSAVWQASHAPHSRLKTPIRVQARHHGLKSPPTSRNLAELRSPRPVRN